MEMQGQDPNNPAAGPQSGRMKMGIDSWIAPNVPGYEQVHNFYMQMAKDIGWSPNAAAVMDPRMTKAMVDLAKNGKLPVGLPLFQTINFGMAGMPVSANGAQAQANSGAQSQNAQSSDQSSSPQAAAAKAVLGNLEGSPGSDTRSGRILARPITAAPLRLKLRLLRQEAEA
ncbi:MAG: hypothetical protein ACRD3T_01145 [Terriglobia bacterium]